MGCPVILTPQAQADLRDIVTYIARDSSDRARRFGNVLIDKAISVGAFPEKGKMVSELNEPSVREIVHGSYRIIYEYLSERNVVYILRFWHGARGYPEIRESENL